MFWGIEAEPSDDIDEARWLTTCIGQSLGRDKVVFPPPLNMMSLRIEPTWGRH